MKRRREFAVLIFLPVALCVGALFFFWIFRAASFWGFNSSASLIFAAFAAVCVVSVLAVKPIPIKAFAVAVV